MMVIEDDDSNDGALMMTTRTMPKWVDDDNNDVDDSQMKSTKAHGVHSNCFRILKTFINNFGTTFNIYMYI